MNNILDTIELSAQRYHECEVAEAQIFSRVEGQLLELRCWKTSDTDEPMCAYYLFSQEPGELEGQFYDRIVARFGGPLH